MVSEKHTQILNRVLRKVKLGTGAHTVIPALGKLRKEDGELEGSLDHTASLRPAGLHTKILSHKKIPNNNNNNQ